MSPEEARTLVHCLPSLSPLLRLDGLCYGRSSGPHRAQAQLGVDSIVILLVGIGLVNGLTSFEERHAKIVVVLWSLVKVARVEILPPSADEL